MPAARNAAATSAWTLPLPFVPPISAPRNRSCGLPSSASSAFVRPSPSLTPNRPRSCSAAMASASFIGKSLLRGRAPGRRPATGPAADDCLSPGELVLVEDALVEAAREAHVRDVAAVQVHAAAKLAAADGGALPHVGL